MNPNAKLSEEKKAATCSECGHNRDFHIDRWGGICVGCPCSGFQPRLRAEELPTIVESDAAMDSYLRDVGDMKAGKPTESAQQSYAYETIRMRGRPVTHKEARESAHRLINSHFDNPDKARCSIPIRPQDDDIIICDYITEQSALSTPVSAPQEDITHTLWYRGGRLRSELNDALVLHPEIWHAEGLQRMLDQWDEIATRYASDILLAPKCKSVGQEETKK